MSVIDANNAYRSLYGAPLWFRPSSLSEVIEDRASRGWFGLAELLDDRPPKATRASEIFSSPARTTLQISSSGEVVTASHVHLLAADEIELTYESTGFSLPSSPDSERGQQTLEWLLGVVSSAPLALPTLGVTMTCAPDDETIRFVGRPSGVVLLRNCKGAPSRFREIESLEELGIPWGSVHDRLRTFGRFSLVFEDPTLGRSKMALRKHQVFPGGPEFITGAIAPIKNLISLTEVRALFPAFTHQEAAAISEIAQGRTIKQAADVLSKSKVTVALQARSALNKTEYASLEELVNVAVFSLSDLWP